MRFYSDDGTVKTGCLSLGRKTRNPVQVKGKVHEFAVWLEFGVCTCAGGRESEK